MAASKPVLNLGQLLARVAERVPDLARQERARPDRFTPAQGILLPAADDAVVEPLEVPNGAAGPVEIGQPFQPASAQKHLGGAHDESTHGRRGEGGEPPPPRFGYNHPEMIERLAAGMGIPEDAVVRMIDMGMIGIKVERQPRFADPTAEEVRGAERGGRAFTGRCYEGALTYLQAHPEATLVHGTVNGTGGLRFGHAWVELPSGRVLDGSTHGFYEGPSYHAELKTAAERRYTYKEALKTALREKNWGPWHETAGLIGRNVKPPGKREGRRGRR